MFSRIKRFFQLRLALPTILLIVGLFLFFSCAFDWFGIETSNKVLYKILEKAGDLILISSIISFLIDSAEYLGVFKKELEDVIYDTNFLKKRNDIESVWVKVSDVLFQSRFPEISRKLMMAVKNYYSTDDGLKLNYYDDYRNIYAIRYDEQNPDVVHIENKTSFVLKVEDEKEFDFPMRFWTCVEENNQGSVETIIDSLSVNGERISNIGDPVKTYADGMICFKFKVSLKGCKEYRIQQVLNNKYNLKEDNYLGFRARWLVNDMRVQVFHPEDMNILFVNRATANGFQVNCSTETFKEYECKGLILKHQGYIIILNKAHQG